MARGMTGRVWPFAQRGSPPHRSFLASRRQIEEKFDEHYGEGSVEAAKEGVLEQLEREAALRGLFKRDPSAAGTFSTGESRERFLEHVSFTDAGMGYQSFQYALEKLGPLAPKFPSQDFFPAVLVLARLHHAATQVYFSPQSLPPFEAEFNGLTPSRRFLKDLWQVSVKHRVHVAAPYLNHPNVGLLIGGGCDIPERIWMGEQLLQPVIRSKKRRR